MTFHICTDCHWPTETAHVHSVNFRRVAWCRECWAARHAAPVSRPEVFIPAQRAALGERVGA